MKKIKKYAKTTLCMALSAAMLFMDMGASVSAAEHFPQGVLEEKTEEPKTEESKIEEPKTEESETKETKTTESAAASEENEEAPTEELSAETASSETVQTEAASAEDTTEETMTETKEISEEETASESEMENETETEDEENIQKLAFSDTDIAHGEYKENGNDITWVIDADGKLTVTGTGNFADDNDRSDERAPWYEHRLSIKTAEVDVQDIKNVNHMFHGCSDLASVDLSRFDTSNAAYMSYMFSDCSNLANLDLSNFDTSNATGMFYMFKGCSNLTNLDLSSFDTSNVKYMGGMFRDCKSLASLDLSSFDTSNVRDMWAMFAECSGLTGLDISSFHTNNAADMSSMFRNCSNLTSLDLSGFNTSNVTNMEMMFDNCSSLTSLSLNGFDTSNVTNMHNIFYGCSGLTSLDISSFDTGKVTNMYGMFADCNNLTSLDLSGFHTNNVIDMDIMFQKCTNLTSLDLGSFDTGNVVNMSSMFRECSNLTNLNLSSFDTGNVKDMNGMFDRCSSLAGLDISSFDTSKVTNMRCMFYDCAGLERLDLSSFNTNNVINMDLMFRGCSSLVNLNLSSFHTSNVTDMWAMFSGCSSLTSLDLSSFDVGKVISKPDTYPGLTGLSGMLGSCNALTRFHTPQNVSTSADLPSGTWYDMSGQTYTQIPMNLPYSILLTKDTKPTVSEQRIAAIKAKTVYQQGDIIELDDLMVRYYDSDGTVRNLTAADYETNVSELDTSAAGDKLLKVTCKKEGKTLTAEVKLTVKASKRKTVQITGIVVNNAVYNKKAASLSGTLAVTAEDGTDVTDTVNLTYTYTGTQADGSSYTATADAPINAGSYTLTVAVAPDSSDYAGSEEYKFKITKAPLIITACGMGLKIGADLPKAEDYRYDAKGLLEGDILITEPAIACSIADSENAGEYEITVSGADAGMNYEITYVNGTLKVSETGEGTACYTVTFNMSGHGADITNTGVKAGSLLEKPADPQADGYAFKGWYKDKDCTAEWDFAADTVQADTTLYARWTADGAEDDDDSPYPDSERTPLASVSAKIADIKTKVYDGDAYEPVVKVTATVDGKNITLTEGADYRVRYTDNTDAGTGKVIVNGNGIYKGQIENALKISPKPMKKLKVITGSVAGTPELSTLPVYVYDGAKRLMRDTDYTLSLQGAQAAVTGKGNYDGSVIARITVYDSSANGKMIHPDNVILNNLKDNETPYTGKAVKPAVTVKINDKTLTNKDYKVQYQNNKNAGTAFVVVTGKGEYRGKAVVTFTIKAETNGLAVKDIPDKTYNGRLQKPAPTVSIQKDGKPKKLAKNKDYTVSYKKNLHAGTATITIKGKGSYAGLSAEKTFKIKPQEIKKAALKGTKDNLTLTYNKKKLKEGYDYEKPVYGEVSKNKAEAVITGKGDFIGALKKSVKVN